MSNKLSFGRDAEDFLRSRSGNSSLNNDNDGGGYGIRITALVPSGNGSVTVHVSVTGCGGQEQSEHILLAEHVSQLSLAIGEISGEIMEEIEYFASVARGYFSAINSFAYGPSSLRALESKLVNKDFDRDVAHEAVLLVKARGYIDECEIAARRAQLLVDKKWGRTRIIAKLREEGFDTDALHRALEELAEVDFAENCAALIRKKFGDLPEIPRERNNALASLSRMGYSSSDIRRAIDLLNDK